MCASWVGIMLAVEKTYSYKKEEQRIENAFIARNSVAEGSWAYNYWSNVIGALTRRLNRLVNNLTDK